MSGGKMRAPAGVAGTLLALAVVGACSPQVGSLNPSPGSGGSNVGPSSSASPQVTQPATSTLRADPPSSVKAPALVDGLPPVVNRVVTTDKVVFLTIDDGYSKDRRILKVLADRGIPVTPFLTRNAIADKRPYFADVLSQTGQTIQNHTVSHPQLPYKSESAQRAEICQASDTYADWFGQRPWMLRPPYGEWNSTTQAAAKACGIRYLVNWSVSLPTSQLRYAEGNKLRSGDIILTHWRDDLYRHLPGALNDIEKQGFKVAALQDYLPAP